MNEPNDAQTTKFAVAPWGNTGQMQLVATTAIGEGEEILSEKPLVWCSVANRCYPTSQWDLVKELLQRQQQRRELLALRLSRDCSTRRDEDDQAIAIELSRRFNTSVANVIALYETVTTNNIASDGPDGKVLGYGMYKVLSRSNHACEPSVILGSNADPSGPVSSMIALRDIRAGEPLTWRYIDFSQSADCSDPLRDFHVRNWQMVNHFGFACRCELCQEQMPLALRGKDVFLFYDDFIKRSARQVIDAFVAAHPPGTPIKVSSQLPIPPSPWRTPLASQ